MWVLPHTRCIHNLYGTLPVYVSTLKLLLLAQLRQSPCRGPYAGCSHQNHTAGGSRIVIGTGGLLLKFTAPLQSTDPYCCDSLTQSVWGLSQLQGSAHVQRRFHITKRRQVLP